MQKTSQVLVALFIFALGLQANAVTLDVVGEASNGVLIGVSGFQFEGQTYDITFQDGTCVDLFSGCDSESDFPFPSESEASDFSLQLSSLLNINLGTNFDRVMGCDTTNCSIAVPTTLITISGGDPTVEVVGPIVANGFIVPVFSSAFGINQILSSPISDPFTYARVSAVPLPATVWLFLSGVGALVGMRKLKAS